MKMTRISLIVLVSLLALALAAPAFASSKEKADIKVGEAALVVQKMMVKDMAKGLLKKSVAVAIFPGVFKAGFILGGQGGKGVILARTKDGSWTSPAFYTIAGASVGLQIGASSTDFMLMIMTANGLKGILEGHAKLGGDASIAAGPVGRSASGGSTFAGKGSDIYSYSMSAGAFAGVALDGAGIEFDADRTKAYYGKAYTPKQILIQNLASKPASAKKLIADLDNYDK